MLGLARLGTNDLAQAKSFYDEIFAILGCELLMSNEKAFVWGKAGEPLFIIGKPFNGEPATSGNGVMIGLPVKDRATVDAIHARALELGGTDEGAPGTRGDPAMGFYAAYLRDPDGNKLVFSCRGAA
jgi:catechol 2,3-dioxygenase-like lactoylglutathione lyase family enzyme